LLGLSGLMSVDHDATFASQRRPFTTMVAQTTSPPNDVDTDPLIAKGSEDAIYIGFILLGTVLMAIVGIFSGRTKTAILFSLFTATVLIAVVMAL
ncbi:MAG: hypothetical protein ACOYM4_14000, partial [Nodosilinea sp.]